MCRVADTSWLTPFPVCPLNVGHIVNNGTRELPANVRYLELDIPADFPLRLRKGPNT